MKKKIISTVTNEEPNLNNATNEICSQSLSIPMVLTAPELRSGRWTEEEEAYCNQLIVDFELGLLDIPERTHLRYYLSVVLNCHQMRISTKYRGIDRGMHWCAVNYQLIIFHTLHCVCHSCDVCVQWASSCTRGKQACKDQMLTSNS